MDSLFKGTRLLANLSEKAEYASQFGIIKGILWHQGENNANAERVIGYKSNKYKLFEKFRGIADNDTLLILVGKLGSFF